MSKKGYKDMQKYKEANRRYRLKNKEKLRIYQKKWRENNSEKVKGWYKRYHSRPEVKERQKMKYPYDPTLYKLRKKDPNFIAKRKNYYYQNSDKIKTKSSIYSTNKRKMVLTHYGNKCACCGEDDYRFLSIDHINGNGNEHRRKIGFGSHILSFLIKNNFPEGFQILCMNCNTAKAWHGICPHKTKLENNDWESEL